VRLLQGHEEREVVEPGTCTFTEMVEGGAIRARRIGKERLCRPEQYRSLELNRCPEVDRVCWKGRRLSQVQLLEKSLIAQALKAQQQRVTGKSGKALVGRIAVSSWIERQHLPQLLSGGEQEVSEFIGTRPEIADAEAARQRGAMQQDSAHSREFHAADVRRHLLPGQARRGKGRHTAHRTSYTVNDSAGSSICSFPPPALAAIPTAGCTETKATHPANAVSSTGN